MQREGLVLGQGFAVAQQLLDRRKQQRRPGGELLSDLVCLGQGRATWHYMVDQAPVLRLGGIHPPAGHEEFHRHVIGDPAA